MRYGLNIRKYWDVTRYMPYGGWRTVSYATKRAAALNFVKLTLGGNFSSVTMKEAYYRDSRGKNKRDRKEVTKEVQLVLSHARAERNGSAKP